MLALSLVVFAAGLVRCWLDLSLACFVAGLFAAGLVRCRLHSSLSSFIVGFIRCCPCSSPALVVADVVCRWRWWWLTLFVGGAARAGVVCHWCCPSPVLFVAGIACRWLRSLLASSVAGLRCSSLAHCRHHRWRSCTAHADVGIAKKSYLVIDFNVVSTYIACFSCLVDRGCEFPSNREK